MWKTEHCSLNYQTLRVSPTTSERRKLFFNSELWLWKEKGVSQGRSHQRKIPHLCNRAFLCTALGGALFLSCTYSLNSFVSTYCKSILLALGSQPQGSMGLSPRNPIYPLVFFSDHFSYSSPSSKGQTETALSQIFASSVSTGDVFSVLPTQASEPAERWFTTHSILQEQTTPEKPCQRVGGGEEAPHLLFLISWMSGLWWALLWESSHLCKRVSTSPFPSWM
jgi:hypothetical protein